MEIKIKAMKCGDSSLIIGPTRQLLVDCGSDNRSGDLNSAQFAYSRISDEIAARQITDLLITHYHNDHFNGIFGIPDHYRFRTIYLPYSIIDGTVTYAGALSRLLAIASPYSWGLRLAENMIELFGKIEKFSSETRFVRAGDKIPLDGLEARVLWPDVTFPYGGLPFDEEEITPETGVATVVRVIDENRAAETLASVDRSLAERFVELAGSENKKLMSAHDEFYMSFSQYVKGLHNDDDGDRAYNNVTYRQMYDTYAFLKDQNKEFRDRQTDRYKDRIRDFSRLQYHSLIRGINAISVIIDCENKFAMLGDAPSNIIDHLHGRRSFRPQYYCVKIQHHATSQHYTDNTPRGTYRIISNGGFIRRKVCDRFVGDGHTVICTSAHENPELFCKYKANHPDHDCERTCWKVVRERRLALPEEE